MHEGPPARAATWPLLGVLAVSLIIALLLWPRQNVTPHQGKAPQSGQPAGSPAAATTAAPATEYGATLEEQRAKATQVKCANNLKQLGLATKVWALDNGGTMPPNIQSMTNELSTPEILVCPADTKHPAATGGWTTYSATNCSYDYLAPSSQEVLQPNRVLFRCPLHGSIALCDGSVQSGVGLDHPNWLVTRGGRVYYQPPGR